MMKNYFGFNLTGKKLLPVWLLFLVLFLVPYVAVFVFLRQVEPGENPPWIIFPLILLLIIIAFAITFYIVKLSIENVAYQDKSIVFNGTFGNFTGKVLLGSFLSIITLGIYMAWFIRDLHRFFIDNSTFDSQSFKFLGQGDKLFVIFLLTLILPVILVTIALTGYIMINPDQAPFIVIIQQVVMMILMIPYMYLVYKWMVNVDFKGLNIAWKTDFWNSCGRIAVEMMLTIITAGIYMPLAMLRMYKYFTERTIAGGNGRELKFGYDIDQLNDFLFIWGQMLLSLITAGVYYPWAFCKIGNRILSKTYLTEA